MVKMMFLKTLVPDFVIRYLSNLKAKSVYGVKIRKGAFVNRKSSFEGRNVIYEKAEISNSVIGFATYVGLNSKIRSAKIGRFCTIADNVRTSLGKHPAGEFVSIHPAFYSTAKQAGFSFVEEQLFEEHTYIDEGKQFVVEIGNDVWIGNNVMITDGVKIGDGAVIAAGSIVTKNIPSYAIYGGIPAKLIRYRFKPEEIEFLLRFKWWQKDFAWLEKHHGLFTSVEKFMQEFQKGKVNQSAGDVHFV